MTADRADRRPPADRRPRADRGAITVEVAILAPVMLALISLAILAMRIEVAREAVTFAAHDAARIASIARTQDDAQAQAGVTAKKSLTNLSCIGGPTATVDTHEFSFPVGQPASVTATVVCVVRLSDLGLPGVPGSITITEQFTSYLDQYRGRS